MKVEVEGGDVGQYELLDVISVSGLKKSHHPMRRQCWDDTDEALRSST